jgi:hypothetical protein
MNTRGKQVSRRLAFIAEKHPAALGNADIAEWYEEGEAIRDTLTAAMHGEVDPGSLPEEPVREWQSVGRDIERHINRQYAALGQRITESGMTPEEAARAWGPGGPPPE